MILYFKANANQKFLTADDSVRSHASAQGVGEADISQVYPTEQRPVIARADDGGAWEEFIPYVRDEHGNLIPWEMPVITPPIPPVIPQPPNLPPYQPTYVGNERAWFQQLVYGKPFGQQTLLELEPTLNANGWTLTPPNAAGDRTKVLYPGGPWTRVGFGEGYWVWVEQS